MARYRGTDAIDGVVDKYGSRGLFISLENGDEVEGAFLGEPEAVETVFNEREGHTEDYDPDKRDHEGLDINLRVKWNFYDRAAEKVRIITLTQPTYKRVRALQDKKGKDRWFTIERRGSKKRTRYDVTPNERIEEREWDDLLGLKLNDLQASGDDRDDERGRRRRRRNDDDRDDDRRGRRDRDEDDRDERRSRSRRDDDDDRRDRDREERRGRSRDDDDRRDRRDRDERDRDDRRSSRGRNGDDDRDQAASSAGNGSSNGNGHSEWDQARFRELKTALNALSDRDYDRFRDEFRIRKTAELPPSAERDAWAFIDAIRKSQSSSQDNGASEVDPFGAR